MRGCHTGMVGVLLFSAYSRADDFTRAALHKVTRLTEDLRYEEAAKTCNEAFLTGGFSLEEYRELAYRCAIVAATLQDSLLTEPRCRLAVALAPDKVPASGTSPRVEKAFAAARAWWATQRPLSVAEATPEPIGTHVILTMRVTSDPLRWVRYVQAHYRADEGVWRTSKPEAIEHAEASVTLDLNVEYYLVALDESRSVVAQIGSAEHPLGPSTRLRRVGEIAPASETESPPVYRRWWFWAAAGVLAGGVAAGGIILYQASQPDSSDLLVRFEAP